MSELSFIGNLKSLKKDMAHMTGKEKLNHIWTYYKWLLVVLVVLIMAVSILLASITNLRKINLLGGISVNVEMSEEGVAYLEDGFKAKIGTGSKRETVVFSGTDVGAGETFDEGYAIQSVDALCANGELDYMIMDQSAHTIFFNRSAYKELNEIFTEEELLELQSKGIGVGYNDDNVPISLDITDCAFIQANAKTKDRVYLMFVLNGPNLNNCKAFLEHILAWEG